MQRLLSTYLFVRRKLTASLLEEISGAGFAEVEIFCSRYHFDYRVPQVARDLGDWLEAHELKLHSLHAPTDRDAGPRRESGLPISICDPERTRRLDAVDEIKRALDVAETVPFRYLVQHVCSSRDTMTDRSWDAAFSSLEHLMVFAKQRGVTLAIENTPNGEATPGNLRSFVDKTRLHDLRMCLDFGHANMQDGVAPAIEAMGDLVVTTHVHDNHGEKDEHLPPLAGTIDWSATASLLKRVPGVLELKEPTSDALAAEPPEPAGLLRMARESLERLVDKLAAKS